MEFSGRLAAFPPSDILQWVFNDRRTGALVVRRSDRTKRIYFRRGDVVACFSDDPAEYYGQLLLIRGLISHDELMRALKTCQQRGLRLGVVLHELGLLSAEVIQRTLREQIEDSVCDVFLWKGGFFYFEEDAPPEEELLPEPISTLRLAMEGSRWVDELDRIRQIFVHDNIVLRPGKLWQTVELSPLQQRIGEQVDGRSNLDEIYHRVNGSYFRFLDACYGMAVHEVVDIASVGDEATGRSYETGVFNLLFQQAANESRNLAQRQPVLPFDVIENLVPLWLGPKPADESGDLWRRCDGSKPLKALLGGLNRVRDFELDQIQLHIRQGRLAFLPCPLKELDAHRAGLATALVTAAPDSRL